MWYVNIAVSYLFARTQTDTAVLMKLSWSLNYRKIQQKLGMANMAAIELFRNIYFLKCWDEILMAILDNKPRQLEEGGSGLLPRALLSGMRRIIRG